VRGEGVAVVFKVRCRVKSVLNSAGRALLGTGDGDGDGWWSGEGLVGC